MIIPPNACKRKHEVFELAVNVDEASVVRIIYDKYVQEGFGAQRIATHLNSLGYRARTGKMWHHATVRGILCNLTDLYRGASLRRKPFRAFAALADHRTGVV